MMTDEKKGIDKFLQWAEKLPPSSAEERASNEAARKSMEGKWLETVTMKEDGALIIATTQYLIGGGIAEGFSESAPGDSDYDDLLRQHGSIVHGKAHTLVRQMIDGNWVVLPESDPVVHQNSKTA